MKCRKRISSFNLSLVFLFCFFSSVHSCQYSLLSYRRVRVSLICECKQQSCQALSVCFFQTRGKACGIRRDLNESSFVYNEQSAWSPDQVAAEQESCRLLVDYIYVYSMRFFNKQTFKETNHTFPRPYVPQTDNLNLIIAFKLATLLEDALICDCDCVCLTPAGVIGPWLNS